MGTYEQKIDRLTQELENLKGQDQRAEHTDSHYYTSGRKAVAAAYIRQIQAELDGVQAEFNMECRKLENEQVAHDLFHSQAAAGFVINRPSRREARYWDDRSDEYDAMLAVENRIYLF